MSKHKIFSSIMNSMLTNFDGQFMNDVEVKSKFGNNAGSIDSMLRVKTTVFIFAYKFDNGVMSANNITQFFRACNTVCTNIKEKHPTKEYTYYKILVTKKPVNSQDFLDQNGKPKFYNLHLNPEDINDLIPESFDSELMDRIMMRVYNAIANTVNDFPGLKEDGDNIRMTYYY